MAKLEWKLLLYDNLLVSSVLRAHYFRRCNFLETNVGGNPSYLWCNILWARELLWMGIRRRLGSGDTISVYHSNWIPQPFIFQPVSANLLDTNVTIDFFYYGCDLLECCIVIRIFFGTYVQQILKIKLPFRVSPDSII